jgi:hypothetical protein
MDWEFKMAGLLLLGKHQIKLEHGQRPKEDGLKISVGKTIIRFNLVDNDYLCIDFVSEDDIYSDHDGDDFEIEVPPPKIGE